MGDHMWDIFICHASEDKEEVAKPLAEALIKAGLTVWLDVFTLRLGDNLRRSIEHGLSDSRFGVVILSNAFFSKEWPQRELDGLLALEGDRSPKILPIRHKVTWDVVKTKSPILAGRVSMSTENGISIVVNEIIRVVRAAPLTLEGHRRQEKAKAPESEPRHHRAAHDVHLSPLEIFNYAREKASQIGEPQVVLVLANKTAMYCRPDSQLYFLTPSWLYFFRSGSSGIHASVLASLEKNADDGIVRLQCSLKEIGLLATDHYLAGRVPIFNCILDAADAEAVSRQDGGVPVTGGIFMLSIGLIDGEPHPRWVIPYGYQDGLPRAILADTGEIVYPDPKAGDRNSWTRERPVLQWP